MIKSLKRNTADRMNYRTMAHELRAMRLGWSGYKLGEALILDVLIKEGCLETPEILERINHKKASEGWKPETTRRMFVHYAGNLRRKGLVKRVYPKGPNWRTGSRSYLVTEKAFEEVRQLNPGPVDAEYRESESSAALE